MGQTRILLPVPILTSNIFSLLTGLGGTKYISFEERQWHNDCFNCKKCSLSLVGRGFLTERDDILCPDCGKDIWSQCTSLLAIHTDLYFLSQPDNIVFWFPLVTPRLSSCASQSPAPHNWSLTEMRFLGFCLPLFSMQCHSFKCYKMTPKFTSSNPNSPLNFTPTSPTIHWIFPWDVSLVFLTMFHMKYTSSVFSSPLPPQYSSFWVPWCWWHDHDVH